MPRDKDGHFFYGRYPTIWKQDTADLTLAEEGAYSRLVDEYMITRHALPASDKAIARIVGVGLDEWLSVKDKVLQYFKPDPIGLGYQLLHSFCERELSEDNERIKRAKINGSKGGRKKAKNLSNHEDKPTPNPDLTQPSTSQPNPTNPNHTISKVIEPNPTSTSAREVNGHGHLNGNGNGWVFSPTDKTHEDLIVLAPGWDRQFLYEKYRSFSRTREPPKNAQSAFLGWARKFTKERPPA